MTVGSSAANPANIELTPMRVSWGGVDLGSTMGNVTVDVKTSKAPITADQYGKSNLDMRVNGLNITVTTELLEARAPLTWNEVFPSMTYTNTSTGAVTFQLPIGQSDLAGAKVLNLHPLVKADSDTTQDHNFYLAYPSEQSSLVYGPSGETKMKLVWNVFPVTTGGLAAAKWYKFGALSVGP